MNILIEHHMKLYFYSLCLSFIFDIHLQLIFKFIYDANKNK